MRRTAVLFASLGLVGCGVGLDFDPPEPQHDASAGDLGSGGTDAGPHDAGHRDGGRRDGGLSDLGIADGAVACRIDAQCDDGLFCNGAERCVSGACVAGTPVVCPTPPVSCVVVACVNDAAACVPHPDDSLCAAGEICDSAHGCVTPPMCAGPGDCPTSDPCIVGTCVAGSCTYDLMACPDPDPTDCLVPACAAGAGGCAPIPVDLLCDDGFFCTADSCDVTSGSCRNVARDAVCDLDGASCTVDRCNPTDSCADPVTGCTTQIDGMVCAAWLSTTPLTGITPGCAVPVCAPAFAMDAATGCAVTPLCPTPGTACVVSGGPATCMTMPTHPCATASACNDGNECNGIEICGTSGVCAPGPPPCGMATGTICIPAAPGVVACGFPASSFCP